VVQEIVVCFSRAVIALGAELGSEMGPVLQPAVPGAWHWLDAQTLTFWADVPFPKATTFRVDLSILAGFISKGEIQFEPWSFSTAEPQVATGELPDDVEAMPELLLKSDVAIDWTQLDKVALWNSEGREHPVRLIRSTQSPTPVYHPYETTFQPVGPLQADRDYTFEVLEGVVSTSGPNRTSAPVVKEFRTFGPLEFKSESCRTDEMFQTRAQVMLVRAWNNRMKVTIHVHDYFSGGLGHVVLQIKAAAQGLEPTQKWSHTIWIQRTSLGLSFFGSHTHDGAPALVTDLKSGKVLTDCQSTVKKGLWRATRGQDTALLPVEFYEVRPELRLYAFTDRHLYRPGEEVRVKGWFRERIWRGNGSRFEAGLQALSDLTLQVLDRDAAYKITELPPVQLSEDGSFSFLTTLEPWMQLSECGFVLRFREGVKRSLSIMLEEFRRPLFQVAVRASHNGGFLVAQPQLRFSAQATYLSGGPVACGSVFWTLYARPVHYVPPGHRNFHFGFLESGGDR